MFIDAGFAAWEERSDADIEEELEELQDELVTLAELVGQRITLVQFDTPRGWIPEIRIEIASGVRLRIYPEDAADHESDSLLKVSQADHT